ncbi:MAG: hypothetical protein FWC87_17240 [Acidimicrobiaceae bacterium]|nr:hypothetical protein [Acidimicrobiaceae bacterium]
MTQTSVSQASVISTINYCGTDGLPPKMQFDLTDAKNSIGGPRDSRETPVYNARLMDPAPTLDVNGFMMLNHPTAVSDFDDPVQVDRYYQDAEKLLDELLHPEVTFMFGHIFRTDDPEETRKRMESEEPLERSRGGTAGGAHVDFAEEAIAQYVEEFGGERAAELAEKRIVNLNVWRPIGKVERMPLALCDGSTASRSGMVPIDMYNAVGPYSTMKVGLSVQYEPGHRWYYYPDMTSDEVLVFKTYDSDPSVVQRVPHSAIVDPTSAPDAPPRHSIEVRALCFLPN